MHVLVVDPDSAGRSAAISVIKQTRHPGGMRISVAGGVAEAMLAFKREHPDLVFIQGSDFFHSSIEIIRSIRATEETRHTGIVFASTKETDDGERSVSCLEAGADDYLRSGYTSAEVVARLMSVIRLKSMTDRLRHANHRLEQQSLTDELTGLSNMRGFDGKYGDLMASCQNGSEAAAVLMMDLDRFKSVNDETNHLVGSYVISEVGGRLRQSGIFKEKDILARFGGDEFIIALQASDFESAKFQAESVREMLSRQTFHCDGYSINLTVSIGLAWVEKGFKGNPQDLIKAADLMLYRSKNLGRNRVSAMVLTYPVNLDMELARRLARRGSQWHDDGVMLDGGQQDDISLRPRLAKIVGE
jgi:diguanylate cyclase (GGDEF)-like protein